MDSPSAQQRFKWDKSTILGACAIAGICLLLFACCMCVCMCCERRAEAELEAASEPVELQADDMC